MTSQEKFEQLLEEVRANKEKRIRESRLDYFIEQEEEEDWMNWTLEQDIEWLINGEK